MATVVFDLPVEIKEIISKYSEVQWDKLVKDTIWSYAKKIQLADKITSKSKLNEENVKHLDKLIKAGLKKHYREK